VRDSFTLVVPIFNESRLIERFWGEIKASGVLRLLDQVIFVDDGSKDQSWLMLESIALLDDRISLIRHSENVGLGGAIHTGIMNCSTSKVLWMPVDLSYAPADVITDLIMNRADAVVLFERTNNQGMHRSALTFLFRLTTQLLFKTAIHKQSGIFLVEREQYFKYMPITRRSLANAEFIIRLVKSETLIEYRSISCHKRSDGRSKIFSVSGILQSFFQLLGLVLLDPSLLKRSKR
jgi:glycosyltransferase involved in cell wall biosynthesis